MRADEIRKMLADGQKQCLKVTTLQGATDTACYFTMLFCAEIAAQLAEMNEWATRAAARRGEE